MHWDDTLLLFSVAVKKEQRVRTHQNVGGHSIEKLFHKTLLDLCRREMSYIRLLAALTYDTQAKATEEWGHGLLSNVAQIWGMINRRTITLWRRFRETGHSLSHLTFCAIEQINLKKARSAWIQMHFLSESLHPAAPARTELIDFTGCNMTFLSVV